MGVGEKVFLHRLIQPTKGNYEMEFNVYKDIQGLWRWQLRASNDLIIADSAESYWNKSDCRHGIDLVKAAYNAPVFEV